MLDQALLFNNLQVLQGHGSSYRMTAAGEPMPKRAKRLALISDALKYWGIDQNRRYRLIRR
ncbi:hypothetical protein D3C73_1330050 [compost metagenome]